MTAKKLRIQETAYRLDPITGTIVEYMKDVERPLVALLEKKEFKTRERGYPTSYNHIIALVKHKGNYEVYSCDRRYKHKNKCTESSYNWYNNSTDRLPIEQFEVVGHSQWCHRNYSLSAFYHKFYHKALHKPGTQWLIVKPMPEAMLNQMECNKLACKLAKGG
jgi:hypothetical protein